MKFKISPIGSNGLTTSKDLSLDELKEALFSLSRMGYVEGDFIVVVVEE